MSIQHFNDLLLMAQDQVKPQHLLFVFVQTELPDEATEVQRREYEQGTGGALKPVFCVPLVATALDGFIDLKKQAASMGEPWKFFFVAAVAAKQEQALSDEQLNSELDRMVAAVSSGVVQSYLLFDESGTPVQLNQIAAAE